jgi:hypothetical protein
MSFWKWFSTKFHSHEWEVLQKDPLILRDYHDPNLRGMGTRYVLQCKVCGELKQKDVK